MSDVRHILSRPVTIGLVAAVLVFAWQALTVHYNYGGNWTGLFCTGATQRVPSDLLGEKIHVIPGAAGYDGQFYHYIAHDPLGRGKFPAYIDAPRFRYARILVPGLAHLLAAGRSRYVDAAYFAVVTLFVFLGAYWLSLFAVLHGSPSVWGLLFLIFPAVVVSVDRMAVDVALAALWVGAAVCWTQRHTRRLFMLLALTPLARETGLALAVAYCLWEVWRRAYGKALVGAAVAIIPFAAWLTYVRITFPPYDAGWLVRVPLHGLGSVVAQMPDWPRLASIEGIVALANLVAAAGSVVAVGLAFRFRLRSTSSPVETSVVVLGSAGLALLLLGSNDVWVHVYGHGRLLTPLLIVLSLRALTRQSWSDLAPLALCVPATTLQVASAGWHILRGVGLGALR
jgi:hypothetical protein